MKVLAVDPGYDRVGFALVETQVQTNGATNEVCLHSETFQTSREEDFNTRLHQVGMRTRELIAQYAPTHLAIETLFFSKNQKTAMQVAQARGTIIYQALDLGLRVCEYSPQQIKIAVTGHGGADKRAVVAMLQHLVALDTRTRLDDEYDAIACALTCLASSRGK
ncbi:MAG: crossover junction endodeoxyribonuclease RuvC [Patescibacteria group bacterium]